MTTFETKISIFEKLQFIKLFHPWLTARSYLRLPWSSSHQIWSEGVKMNYMVKIFKTFILPTNGERAGGEGVGAGEFKKLPPFPLCLIESKVTLPDVKQESLS